MEGGTNEHFALTNLYKRPTNEWVQKKLTNRKIGGWGGCGEGRVGETHLRVPSHTTVSELIFFFRVLWIFLRVFRFRLTSLIPTQEYSSKRSILRTTFALFTVSRPHRSSNRSIFLFFIFKLFRIISSTFRGGTDDKRKAIVSTKDWFHDELKSVFGIFIALLPLPVPRLKQVRLNCPMSAPSKR